jgi:AcrR family transcriptional regulator
MMRIRMKSEERRADILRTAIHLFAGKGFRGTTTRELAAAAGVTEPVLYQHFPSKKDLYAAIIEAKAGSAPSHAAELRALAASGNDEQFLTALGELILRRYQDDPELSRLLLFSSLENHELSDLFFERVYEGFYKLVTGYIRRRGREGAFRKVNAEIAARSVLGMITYHGHMALLFPGRFTLENVERLAAQTAQIFLDGIRVATR